MAYGRRDINHGPWRYCARCGEKKLIYSELEWQRGKLMCKKTCIDKWLVGQREVIIAAVLQDGDAQRELAPVPKLSEPYLEEDDGDILV